MTTLQDKNVPEQSANETISIDLRATLAEGAKDVLAGLTDLTVEQVLVVNRTLKRAIELQLSRVGAKTKTELGTIDAELKVLRGTLASLGETRAVDVARRIDRFVTAIISRLIDAATAGLLPIEGRA